MIKQETSSNFSPGSIPLSQHRAAALCKKALAMAGYEIVYDDGATFKFKAKSYVPDPTIHALVFRSTSNSTTAYKLLRAELTRNGKLFYCSEQKDSPVSQVIENALKDEDFIGVFLKQEKSYYDFI